MDLRFHPRSYSMQEKEKDLMLFMQNRNSTEIGESHHRTIPAVSLRLNSHTLCTSLSEAVHRPQGSNSFVNKTTPTAFSSLGEVSHLHHSL